MELYCVLFLSCENIRFSSLFSARNVPSGEERGETGVFVGYPFPRAGFLQISRLRHAERIGIIFGYTVDSRYLEPSREIKKSSSYRELGENSWKQEKKSFSLILYSDRSP